MNREAIMSAFAALVATATVNGQSAFPGGVGRRLKHFTEVDAQPAAFVRHIAEEYHPRQHANLPPKVTLHTQIWIYALTGAEDIPDSTLNPLLDAIDAVLVPAGADRWPANAVTLGGQVAHCWIEGEVAVVPGDQDSQGLAIIPVKILVPT